MKLKNMQRPLAYVWFDNCVFHHSYSGRISYSSHWGNEQYQLLWLSWLHHLAICFQRHRSALANSPRALYRGPASRMHHSGGMPFSFIISWWPEQMRLQMIKTFSQARMRTIHTNEKLTCTPIAYRTFGAYIQRNHINFVELFKTNP